MGKSLDKLTLFRLVQRFPVRTQRKFRHFTKVKTGKNQFKRALRQSVRPQFRYRGACQYNDEVINGSTELLGRLTGMEQRRS